MTVEYVPPRYFDTRLCVRFPIEQDANLRLDPGFGGRREPADRGSESRSPTWRRTAKTINCIDGVIGGFKTRTPADTLVRKAACYPSATQSVSAEERILGEAVTDSSVDSTTVA